MASRPSCSIRQRAARNPRAHRFSKTRCFGSSSNPLYENVTRVTTINNGGSGTALDTNNSASNDAFQTDIGNGLETLIYDGIAAYSGTVTYTDGTTASFTAIVAQTTSGDLFLAPPTSANGDVAVLTARPIESITLGNVINNNADMANDRQDIGIDDGVVDGTAGDDLIDASYVEPVASGSDRVDNNDAPGGGNADAIEAGGGNDTVLAGLGNDSIDGGSGNDSLDGGAGSDLMQGGIGLDTLLGGAGDDTLDGGDGADVLVGDGGAGLKWNYEVYTRDFSSANGQAFDIESGTACGKRKRGQLRCVGAGPGSGRRRRSGRFRGYLYVEPACVRCGHLPFRDRVRRWFDNPYPRRGRQPGDIHQSGRLDRGRSSTTTTIRA